MEPTEEQLNNGEASSLEETEATEPVEEIKVEELPADDTTIENTSNNDANTSSNEGQESDNTNNGTTDETTTETETITN